MIGIYLLTNLINNKKYVGQSKRLMERLGEHYRSAQPELYKQKNEKDSNVSIHQAMQKYGICNFSFQILEICTLEELDNKEKYWINYYDSFNNGYNETKGGQQNFALKGEKHSQAKLKQQDVDIIKNLLSQNYSLEDIIKDFPFVSKSTISMINNGKIWIDRGRIYPIAKLSTNHIGSKNGRSKLTENDVILIRTRYSKGETIAEIYKDFKEKISESTLESAIYGKTFKHLPIYKKQEKKWIEPCIDYPQSLK